MEVKRIYEISVGDIVAEDIFRGQLLLLAGGTIITEKILSKLKKLGIEDLVIYPQPKKKLTPES